MPAYLPVALPPVYTPISGQSLLAAGHMDDLHEQDRLEIRALGTKLGLGSSSQTPAANLLLGGDGAGTSRYRQLVAGDVPNGLITAAMIATGGHINGISLNYLAATDIASGVAVSATTWTNINTDQSFSVGDTNTIVEISVRGNVILTNAGGVLIGASILIDGTTRYMIGGGAVISASDQVNVLAGSTTVAFSGLSAGSHTVRVQCWASGASTLYCRPSSQPNTEALGITVMLRAR